MCMSSMARVRPLRGPPSDPPDDIEEDPYVGEIADECSPALIADAIGTPKVVPDSTPTVSTSAAGAVVAAAALATGNEESCCEMTLLDCWLLLLLFDIPEEHNGCRIASDTDMRFSGSGCSMATIRPFASMENLAGNSHWGYSTL